MLLRALYDLYDRLEKDERYQMAPRGYSLQNVTFKLVIELDGRLHSIVRLEGDDGGGPRKLQVPGGPKKTGSGLNPSFLWDKAEYLLGFVPPDDKKTSEEVEKVEKRALRAFAAFRESHLGGESKIDCPEFSAVCRFLESWEPDMAADYPDLMDIDQGYGVFQIRAQEGYVHEQPGIRAWWDARPDWENWTEDDGGDDAVLGQCVVTGERDVPIARKHPPIKGVFGAQSTGAALVSFNNDSFASYGKKQSFNAPISETAAYRYTRTLNTLLSPGQRDRHNLLMSGVTVIFWTEEGGAPIVEDAFLRILGHGSAAVEQTDDPVVRERIAAFLKALRRGRIDDVAMDGLAARARYWIVGLARMPRGFTSSLPTTGPLVSCSRKRGLTSMQSSWNMARKTGGLVQNGMCHRSASWSSSLQQKRSTHRHTSRLGSSNPCLLASLIQKPCIPACCDVSVPRLEHKE